MLRTIRTFELAKNIGSFVFKRHTSPKNHLFVQQGNINLNVNGIYFVSCSLRVQQK